VRSEEFGGEREEGKRAKRKRKKAEKKALLEASDVISGKANCEDDSSTDQDSSAVGSNNSTTVAKPYPGEWVVVENNKATVARVGGIVSNAATPVIAGCLTREEALKQTSCSGALLTDCEPCVAGGEDQLEDIPWSVIERHRISVEKIREIDRFKDYTEGEPCRTLYLKNLSARVTRNDLVSMFQRFRSADDPPILYRLLTGRLRGQAFVTFPSVQAAVAALALVNGYDFKGKHIIIQYGRKGLETDQLTLDHHTADRAN